MIFPIDVPLVTASGLAAVTDASGNFTSTTMIHASNWSAVRLVGQVAGSPTWSLLSDSGLPVDFSPGSLASMGQVLVAPGQRLTVQIASASPNVAVSGHFVGIMSPALEEVIPYHTPSPNQAGVSVSPIAQVLGSVTTAVLAPPVSQSFPVPKGTQAIGFAGVMPLGGTPTVTVTGDQSGIQYFAAGTFIPAGPPTGAAGQTVQATLLDPFDTSVTIAIANATSSSTVELLAWATMPTVFSRQLAGDSYRVIGVTGAQPVPIVRAPADIPNTVGRIASAGIAAGGSVTMIPGVGVQHIRLMRFGLQIVAAAGSFGELRRSDNTTIINIDFGQTEFITAEFSGFDLGASLGLIITNTSPVASGALNGYCVANQS